MSRPLRTRVTWWLAAVVIALVVLEVLFAGHYRPVFPWHHLPGYAALIGLVGCLAVVILSKALGKWFLQRPARDDD